MRLTLRTLLAYMDDILEPEDREDLRAKIEHSEFASDLLHRARDVMRRLRLGAATVTDARKGMDANSVAEYLDNTMPPEQVADFERLCLESDMQLAEVASCHQILTMVLGEPADVRPEARARMYDIPAASDLAAIPAADVEDGPAPTELPRTEMPQIDVTSRRTSQVPDYLRGSFFERHGAKLIAVAVLLLVGAAILFWPVADPQLPNEVAQRGDVDPTMAPVVESGDVESTDATGAGAPANASTEAERYADGGELEDAPPFRPDPVDTDEEVEPSRLEAAAASDQERDPPLEASDIADLPDLPPSLAEEGRRVEGTQEEAPETVESENAVRLPSEFDISSSSDAGLSAPPLPAADGSVGAVTERPESGSAGADFGTPVSSNATSATSTESTPTLENSPQAPSPEDAAVGNVAAGETTATAAAVDSASPGTPQHVATYVSRGEMLLRHEEQSDAQSDAWMRLSPLAQIFEGDQLLALPASRPMITLLTTNLSIQLQPATRVVLAAEESGGMPNLGGDMAPAGVDVQYGRVVIFNPAQSGSWVAVQLRLGASTFVVELDGGSTVAVDVQRELPPGVNPLEGAGGVVADLYATTGKVRWQAPSGSVRAIDPPAHWQVAGDQVGSIEPLASEPRWISEDTISQTDRLAVTVVEPAVKTDRPARVSLVELAGAPIVQRRREAKALVTRASVHIGEFEPFVKALNDSSQSHVWDEHIATLRSAMALGPQVAEDIREAFRNYKGREAGDELFRLLWGYSKEQLEGGALEDLISYLDHESLDFRVVAFNNLYRATGKQLEYRPHDPPQLRQGPIRQWRMRLMEGDLEVRPQGTGS